MLTADVLTSSPQRFEELTRHIASRFGRGDLRHRAEAYLLGLVDAVRWLLGPESDADVDLLVVNPSRRGRVEPRVTKRRPKPHVRIMRPRAELRKQLMRQ